MNYFEVLDLSIEDSEKKDEEAFKKSVHDAFRRIYNLTTAGINNPYFSSKKCFKGKDQKECQKLLLDAKDILVDEEKRKEHIKKIDDPDPPQPDPPQPDPPQPDPPQPRLIATFPNGDKATSISKLATLMIRHSDRTKDVLYDGSLATALDGAGELFFAKAARAVVKKYPNDQDFGLRGMVQILKEKIQLNGSEAGTPQQLAKLIDQNWPQAKTLLFNGFIALWLEYVNQGELAKTAEKVTSGYADERDIGLEMFVQKLDPRIGSPEPETSHTSIKFGKIDNETQKTIRLEIKNTGRGFLHGDVNLASKMPGLQISSTRIRRSAAVTVELDASSLTAKQTHKTELIIKTNGGNLEVPISCYVDYPIQKSIRRVAISGVSIGAIALVARLILIEVSGFSWLVSARFVNLNDLRWIRWFEWPMLEWQVYVPRFAGFSFVVVFAALAALGTGIFFFFRKRRSG